MSKKISLLLLTALLLTSCGGKPTGPRTDSSTTGNKPQTLSKGEYPLYFATMTHMEGEFNDDTDEDLFNKHVDMLRYAMDLAEAEDGILTIESEKPFAKGNTIWDVNIMKEILDRGHGVGTHCDLGFDPSKKGAELTVDELAQKMEENKSLVDGLVGAENNHGCSGAGSSTDWVLAAQEAGFDYINGIVGMHLLAIPQENRPDSSWTDQYIISKGYHISIPDDLMDRIYLMKLKNTDDFVADDTGIVISNGEMGPLANLAEGGESKICGKSDCPFTDEDVDSLVATLKSVNEDRDLTRVAKVTAYLPVNLFVSQNDEPLKYFFSEMKKLQDDGTIQWSSQWDIVKTYLDANP